MSFSAPSNPIHGQPGFARPSALSRNCIRWVGFASLANSARSVGPPAYHARGAHAIPRLAWVALGSNLGDRQARIRWALRWLDTLPQTRLAGSSPLIRTVAVGPPQPDYLNGIARLETTLSPLELLDALLTLERAAGRVRTPGERWGPRTLDLDLLHMVGPDGRGLCLMDPRLTLPHPRLEERRFVLEPFALVDPGLVLMSGLTVMARLETLPP